MNATTKEVSSKERDLLSFIYDAFNRREIEPILQRMHPEVEWPNGMEGGWVHGREGIRAYWTRQWGMLNPRVDPVGIEADSEGRIVVNVHQVIRDLAGALLFDRTVQHIYLIKDSLILRMNIRE